MSPPRLSAEMPHTATETPAEDGGSASKPQRIIKLGKTPDDSDKKVLFFIFFNYFWRLLPAYPTKSEFQNFWVFLQFLKRLYLLHSNWGSRSSSSSSSLTLLRSLFLWGFEVPKSWTFLFLITAKAKLWSLTKSRAWKCWTGILFVRCLERFFHFCWTLPPLWWHYLFCT